jgi:hypothetical protein
MPNTHVVHQCLPGEGLSTGKMPGHWFLARLGKTVLRPGGVELTRWMLSAMDIGPADAAVEFAPGLGVTAKLTLARRPAAYTAIERDPKAAAKLQAWLAPLGHRCLYNTAEQTGLSTATATAVYGEAMLTMNSPQQKDRIVAEAARILQPGGRYGIHELCILPEDIPPALVREMEAELSRDIHVGVRLLTVSGWKGLLETHGFQVEAVRLAPMRLLEPLRVIRDEGLLRTARIIWNAARDPGARCRLSRMRSLFRRYRNSLSAIAFVGVKQSQ